MQAGDYKQVINYDWPNCSMAKNLTALNIFLVILCHNTVFL